MQKLATLIALVALTSVASAAVTGAVTNDTASFSGYVVNEISIDTGTEEWVTSELIVVPDQADMVYNASYSYTLPTPPFSTIIVDPFASDQVQATIDYYTELEFDSRIATGVFVGGEAEASYTTLSAPAAGTKVLPMVAAGGDEIRVTWYTLDVVESGALDMAMVTLGTGAETGSWSFEVYTAGSAEIPAWTASGDIEDGKLIPEPASMLMLIGGGLGLLMRRRK